MTGGDTAAASAAVASVLCPPTVLTALPVLRWGRYDPVIDAAAFGGAGIYRWRHRRISERGHHERERAVAAVKASRMVLAAAICDRRRFLEHCQQHWPAATRMLQVAEDDISLQAVSNWRCPPALIGSCLTDPDETTRLAAAANVSCPAGVLAVLSRSTDPAIRRNVASNPACPSCVLDVFVRHDPEEDVRAAAARHRRLPDAALRKAARDPRRWVRASVSLGLICLSDRLGRCGHICS